MFAGDRWIKAPAAGRNGDYVLLPMEFAGDKPIIHSYQDWDLELRNGIWRPFDPKRNLALGKTATESSKFSAHAAQSVLESTTWRDYNKSYWQSEAGDNQWIRVDFGAPMEIDRAILKWNVNGAKDFKIQTSTDGQTWSDVYGTTPGSSDTVTDVTFDQTTARYVRMVATAPAPVAFGGFGRRGRGGVAPARLFALPIHGAERLIAKRLFARGRLIRLRPRGRTGRSTATRFLYAESTAGIDCNDVSSQVCDVPGAVDRVSQCAPRKARRARFRRPHARQD